MGHVQEWATFLSWATVGIGVGVGVGVVFDALVHIVVKRIKRWFDE